LLKIKCELGTKVEDDFEGIPPFALGKQHTQGEQCQRPAQINVLPVALLKIPYFIGKNLGTFYLLRLGTGETF
jgi:hypothetical protein